MRQTISYPIILCANDRVMDSIHQVVKAILSNHSNILAVQFEQTLKPDSINID